MPKLIKNFPTPESLRPEKTALLRTARKVLEPLRGCIYVLSQHRALQNEAFEEQLNTNRNVSCTGNHSLPAAAPKVVEHVPSPLTPAWQKYGAPLIVLLPAIAIIVTITRNWNGWKADEWSRSPTTRTYAAISRR